MPVQIKVSAMLLEPEQTKALTAVASDLAALRASVVAITAKLDTDAGVTATDFAATCNPAALQTTP